MAPVLNPIIPEGSLTRAERGGEVMLLCVPSVPVRAVSDLKVEEVALDASHRPTVDTHLQVCE